MKRCKNAYSRGDSRSAQRSSPPAACSGLRQTPLAAWSRWRRAAAVHKVVRLRPPTRRIRASCRPRSSASGSLVSSLLQAGVPAWGCITTLWRGSNARMWRTGRRTALRCAFARRREILLVVAEGPGWVTCQPGHDIVLPEDGPGLGAERRVEHCAQLEVAVALEPPDLSVGQPPRCHQTLPRPPLPSCQPRPPEARAA